MDLPPEIADFISDNIDSVAELEALLLMRRQTAIAWDDVRLADGLYIDRARAVQVLDALLRRALVVRVDQGFQYGPADEVTRLRIDSLAQLHTRLLIPITHLIHEKPNRSLRQFSDAFRLRDKK